MEVSFPRTLTLLIEVPEGEEDEEIAYTLTLEEFNLGEDGTVTVETITSKAIRLGGTTTNDDGEPAEEVAPGHGSKLTVYRQGDARN